MKGLVVGLTGGIGSGKSAAAGMFAELGAAVIDADAIAHELTTPGGAAMPAIEQAFGRAVVAADGSLDRAAMRRIAFADTAARARLESLLHPMIGAASAERRDAAWAAGAPYVLMVVPLLVETGADRKRFDCILVIDCPEALQAERVLARSGLSAAEVAAIMATQAGRAQRLAVADDVIVNDGDWIILRRRVEAQHVKYCAMADKIRTYGK